MSGIRKINNLFLSKVPSLVFNLLTTQNQVFIQCDESNPKSNKNHQSIEIIFKTIPSLEHMNKVLSSSKFKNWFLGNWRNEAVYHTMIHIDSFTMFGPNNVGFIYANGNFRYQEDDTHVPSISFLRGGAVAVLFLMRIPEKTGTYTLLVKQYRVPVAKTFIELVAGMLDGSHNFCGVAAKEIKEETGISVIDSDLEPFCSIAPSPGGCDEEIDIFTCRMNITQEAFDFLQNKLVLNREGGENEKITLIMGEIDELYNQLTRNGYAVDAKFLSAYPAHLLTKNCSYKTKPTIRLQTDEDGTQCAVVERN